MAHVANQINVKQAVVSNQKTDPIPDISEDSALVLKTLTNLSVIMDPGHAMKQTKGTIRPHARQSKCPKCGKKFLHLQKMGYICLACQTVPSRFYIDLMWDGQRIRVHSDEKGAALDSYYRAGRIFTTIQHEINNHIFDPSKYLAADIKKYWLTTQMDNFLNDKIDSIAPSYQKDYKRYALAAKIYFKNTDVRDLKKTDFKKFIKFIEKGEDIADESKRKPRSGRTVKHYLDFLKTFMYYLKNEEELLQSVPSFPKIDVEEYDWIWLDAETQANILNHVRDEDKPIVIFLMLHGCRPGEARALKCRNVDLKKQIIKISATFSGTEIREKRKGKKSRSVIIPIHPEIYDYITNRVLTNLPDAHVFVNKRAKGRPYSMSATVRLWAKVRGKAGLTSRLRMYDATRHSFASNLVNNDVSLFSVSKLLGHSSVKMTEKYAHTKTSKLHADMATLSLKTKGTIVSINTRNEDVKSDDQQDSFVSRVSAGKRKA